MQQPPLQEIDQIRQQGMRPQIVGCFLNNKKVLFLYSKKYNLWQFAQGGIDNLETIDQAFKREFREELGSVFMAKVESDFSVIGDYEIIFPASNQGSRELKTDDGQDIVMKGKKYFFVVGETETADLDIDSTEFDDYRWVSLKEGNELCETIYQKNKRAMTKKILDILGESGLLA